MIVRNGDGDGVVVVVGGVVVGGEVVGCGGDVGGDGDGGVVVFEGFSFGRGMKDEEEEREEKEEEREEEEREERVEEKGWVGGAIKSEDKEED